ncbi:MAG TPA: hypothetical protein VKC66_34005 [Xanthobacteraceae bacterium]|nr:hypothetical protein [Xanthobacteraceae bacterium]
MSADDEAATRLVSNILGDSATNGIDFAMGDIAVSREMYHQVSQAIADRKITVLVQPNLLQPDEAGRYWPDLKFQDGREFFDILILRFPDLGTGINEQSHRAAAIVHECTHAGFAMRRVPHMTRTLHEAGAYTAESMFLIAKMLSLGGHPERVTKTQPIESAAWDLARLLSRSNAAAPNTDAAAFFNSPDFAVELTQAWSALFTAIAASDKYRAVARDPVENVGLGRQWITQPRTH